MKIIHSNPKAQLLLEASIEVLHHESKEWLSNIEFWQEEMQFFDKILHLQDPLYKEDKTYRNMLEDLEEIQGDVFVQLKEDIISHEKVLAALEQNKTGHSDSEYREKHAKIKARELTMEDEIKSFKKVVFGFVMNLRS